MGGNDQINAGEPSAPPIGYVPHSPTQITPAPYTTPPGPGSYAMTPIKSYEYQPPRQPIMTVDFAPTLTQTQIVAPVSVLGQDPLLEGLLAFPSLFIKQDIRSLCAEMYCRFVQANSYSIYNPNHGFGWHQQQILHVKETSGCIDRFCCHARRGFTLNVSTADKREVILIDRPFRPYTQGGCFCYCLDSFYQVIDVYSGKDTRFGHTKLGRVRQNFSFFKPYLTIYDANGKEVYRLLANCVGCGKRKFRIFRGHERNMEKRHQIGAIRKKWGGFEKEFLTNCDNFSIDFPADSNHVQRALLIATCLFIDYLYYENAQTVYDETLD